MTPRAPSPLIAAPGLGASARRFVAAVAMLNGIAVATMIFSPIFRVETAASLRVVVLLMLAMLLAELRPSSIAGPTADLAQAVSWIIAGSMVLLGAPHLAALTLTATALIGAVIREDRFLPALFNASQLSLSIVAGAVVIRALGQHAALTPGGDVHVAWLPTALLAGMSVIFVNGILTGFMRSLTQDGPAIGMIRAAIDHTIRNEGVLLTLAPATAVLAVRSPLLLPIPLITAFAVYRQANEATTQKQAASHDLLTGLLNRRAFEQATERSLTDGGSAAIALIDLDGFKGVNDRLGHQAGDVVLQTVADRISQSCGSTDIPARLGGDEFAAYLAGPVDAVMETARRIVEDIRRPIRAGATDVEIGASLGLALTPEHGVQLSTLLERADATMYQAKRDRGGVVLYQPGGTIDPVGRTTLQRSLRTALDDDDFVAHYQPWVDARTGRVLGVEALARWPRPEYGLWLPEHFLPLLTEPDLAHRLTVAMLERTLDQARIWSQDGFDVAVSVNTPVSTIRTPAFAADLEALLYRFPIDPGRLALEVDDSGLAQRDHELLEALARIRRLGAGLLIDDLGAGPDSLVSISALGAHTVKLTPSLTRGLGGRPRAQTVLRHLIAMGLDLDITVVAKRIEDADSARVITEAGGAIQGHLVTPARDAAALTSWLTDRRARRQAEVRDATTTPPTNW